MNLTGVTDPDGLAAALAGDHEVITRAMLYKSGAYVQDLPIVTGKVDVTADAAITRRCDVTLIDEDGTLTPASSTDLLSPFGAEIRLYRGAMVDGTAQLCPLGVFAFATVEMSDDGTGRQLKIQGYDRAQRLIDAKFVDTTVVPHNTQIGGSVGAIHTLLADGWPDFTALSGDWGPASYSTLAPLVYDANTDRWEAMRALATSMAHTLRFAADGSLALTAIPDFGAVAPVVSYVDGESGTILTIKRSMSTRETYSSVIAVGQSTGITSGAPARGVATDPTLVAKLGTKPLWYESDTIYTDAQALDVATALLRQHSVPYEEIEVQAICDPRLDIDDVVFIARDDAKIGDRYVVDSVSIPLDAATPMTFATKRRVS